MGWFCPARVGGVVLLLLAALEPAAAEPRRVLLLHSFGPQFAPWNVVTGRFREELFRQSPDPIDLYESSLASARLVAPQDDEPLVDYLRALFAGRNLELVVAMGAPAARFFQRYRPQLFPSTPLLIAAADRRALAEAALTPNDTAVAVSFDQTRLIENILQLLPDTKAIVVATGASPIEKFWLEDLRRAFQPLTNRVTFEWLNELSLDDMLQRVGKLPPHSAIYYNHIHVDARGVPQEDDRAFSRLHQVANAPMFSFIDSNFGRGIVGGPLVSTEKIAQRTAAVAARILRGEPAGSIKTPTFGLEEPMYDWRELQRWNIGEARLPAGSIVQFREPSAWQRYRWQLMAVFIALLFQATMITWLLFERRSRRNAELESRRRLLQVLHLSRTAEAGALSASFAHELSQPLGAIMLNTDVAERLLGANPPEVGRLKEVLADIRQADQHAAEIIQHLGKLLKRRSHIELQEFDLADAIAGALHIVSPEATKRNVTLRANGAQQPLPVRADRVHLQQVILILVTNAMDALADTAPDARRITVQTAAVGGSAVEVSVSDSGTGIPEHALGEVFDTFYTTKKQGTGLGLSIARTIVETYGGRIWAENKGECGAVFRFTLPLLRLQ
jgi:signal transduction histidine kinase